MKVKKKRLSVYKIFFSLLIVSFLVFSSFLIVKLFLIKDLPGISDPIQFAESFNPKGITPIKFEVECKFFAINCEGNDYFVSPYFPYLELRGQLIDQNSNHWRTLWHDPLWNLYWVGVQDGEYRMGQVFFGPYKKI